ncbi:MAG: cation-transporting P-type ATPase [Clostridia bacterium]|nr:cation-transporting P-type ATPase [Clostridia bacterium]
MNLLEINASKLYELLRTDADAGLKSEDVEKNRQEFAPSSVSSSKSLSAVMKSVFKDVMPLIFVFLSLVSLRFEGGGRAWFSLLLFAVIYVLFKFFSIRYSAKVSKQLNVSSTRVTVIRDGEELEVDYSELVPGDVMLVERGDVVPCDALVIWQSTLRVSEIQLTGNSSPVLKLTQDDVLRGKGVPYYECILFAGSVVLSGRAKVLVCNTGKDVFDKKNKLTSRSKHARRTRIFELSSFVSQQISLVWILLCFFVFILGIMKGQSAFSILYLSTTLAVASLPDLVLTLFDLTLSVGSNRLYKKGCTIRDMSSLDRMCDISCIMVDNSRYFRASSPKPNTIYVNDERKKFRGAGDEDVRELFELAVVASVSDDGGMIYNGVSVERSLVSCAEEIGISRQKLYDKYLLLEKRPFTEENGMSRVIVFKNGEFFIISIGSPSIVLKTCSYIENKGETQLLDERQRRTVRELSRTIARDNEGVVAIAVKKIEYREGTNQIDNNRGYSFKGYIGLHTSIKADSARAVSVCQKSGIDVVLMSSEGLSTSTGFAKSLSILRDDDKVIEAKELVQLDMGVFRADIKNYKVYVSLTPSQMSEIASWRKSDGDIIAVTATSIEDLALLLEGDVSFCSADSDDEATRQNSDVLVDGSFELIPECIKHARSIYRNVRHTLQYLLNYQFVLFFSFVISMMFLGKPVFSSGIIMTYSILISIPLSLALAVEGLRGNELRDTFGSQNLEINAQNLILIPAICGFVSGVVITLSVKVSYLISSSLINGSAFVTLVSSAVFMAYALSSDDSFDAGVFKNRHLHLASLFSFGIMALFTFVKPLASLIGINTPTPESFALSILIGLVPSLICIGIRIIKKYVFNNNEKIKA